MPKKIKSWEDLVGLESEKYKLRVELLELGGGCAWILPKVETEETKKNFLQHHWYLSTHAFYPSALKETTQELQRFGFDVEIVNGTK